MINKRELIFLSSISLIKLATKIELREGLNKTIEWCDKKFKYK